MFKLIKITLITEKNQEVNNCKEAIIIPMLCYHNNNDFNKLNNQDVLFIISRTYKMLANLSYHFN